MRCLFICGYRFNFAADQFYSVCSNRFCHIHLNLFFSGQLNRYWVKFIISIYKCIFRGLSSMICLIGTSLPVWGRPTRISTTAQVGCTRRGPPSICRRMISQCCLIHLSDFRRAEFDLWIMFHGQWLMLNGHTFLLLWRLYQFRNICFIKFYFLLYPVQSRSTAIFF